MKKEVKIGVVGLWHLGCVLSAAWAKLGFCVTGFDYSKDLIGGLRMNKAPIFEPGLDDTLASEAREDRMFFTNDIKSLADCDFVFLSYDTPVLDNDDSDLTLLNNTIDALGDALKEEAVVIVSSQTPVGTCDIFRSRLKEKKSGLELVYSPENLRLGEAIKCYLDPGRIIVGANSETALSKVVKLFNNVDAQIITMNIASAEMVKHAINSYLAASITFANHLADLCDVSGANVFDVVNGMKSDPRIGNRAYLSAGIGFSGGTLGRDLKVLSGLNDKFNKKADIFESIYNYNCDRKHVILSRVEELLSDDLQSKQVGVLGVTYKPNTSTLRRSMPIEIINLMIKKGADVVVFDPKADYDEYDGQKEFKIADSADEVIGGSELVILFTEWPEFQSVAWDKCLNVEKPQIIFDAKNYLTELNLSKIGYRYYGVGYKQN